MRDSSLWILSYRLAIFVLASGSLFSICYAQQNDQSTPRDIVANPTIEDLPVLFEIAGDETHCFPKRSTTTHAIANLGRDAVPSIVVRIEETRDSSWTSQVNYLYYLVLIGPNAEAAIPTLDEIIAREETHNYVRHYAMTAKAVIQNDLDEIARLATKRKDFGFVALDVLKSRGSESSYAVAGLAEMARENRGQRRRYLEALELIDAKVADELREEFAR